MDDGLGLNTCERLSCFTGERGSQSKPIRLLQPPTGRYSVSLPLHHPLDSVSAVKPSLLSQILSACRVVSMCRT